MAPGKRKIRTEEESSRDVEIQRTLNRNEEMSRLMTEIKRVNSLLNAALAFEDISHKIHRSWKSQLRFCEERLKELKAPLKTKKK